MSKTEFDLSGKIVEAKEVYDAVNKAKEGPTGQYIMTSKSTFLHTSFVEEFIRLLKNEFQMSYYQHEEAFKIIDKLSGDKLTK